MNFKFRKLKIKSSSNEVWAVYCARTLAKQERTPLTEKLTLQISQTWTNDRKARKIYCGKFLFSFSFFNGKKKQWLINNRMESETNHQCNNKYENPPTLRTNKRNTKIKRFDFLQL